MMQRPNPRNRLKKSIQRWIDAENHYARQFFLQRTDSTAISTCSLAEETVTGGSVADLQRSVMETLQKQWFNDSNNEAEGLMHLTPPEREDHFLYFLYKGVYYRLDVRRSMEKYGGEEESWLWLLNPQVRRQWELLLDPESMRYASENRLMGIEEPPAVHRLSVSLDHRWIAWIAKWEDGDEAGSLVLRDMHEPEAIPVNTIVSMSWYMD
jgi:hypothetical protein